MRPPSSHVFKKEAFCIGWELCSMTSQVLSNVQLFNSTFPKPQTGRQNRIQVQSLLNEIVGEKGILWKLERNIGDAEGDRPRRRWKYRHHVVRRLALLLGTIATGNIANQSLVAGFWCLCYCAVSMEPLLRPFSAAAALPGERSPWRHALSDYLKRYTFACSYSEP